MDIFLLLINRCKCGVYLNVNEHRNIHQSASDRLTELRDIEPDGELELEKKIEDKIIELNTIVDLQFYPDTPIGFYHIYHYDVTLAICQALEVLGIAPPTV
jgi:hypothetical protein